MVLGMPHETNSNPMSVGSTREAKKEERLPTSSPPWSLRPLTWAFGNPILAMDCIEAGPLNEQLASLIRNLEKRAPGLKQSNRGGWQSEKNLHTIKCESVTQLLALIDMAVRRMMAEVIGQVDISQIERTWDVLAWANINRQFDFNTVHYHIGGFWSGVYYVTVPDNMSAGDGTIAFKNPTFNAMLANLIRSPRALRDAFKPNIRITPKPGMLLMFPSWLEHSVDAHHATGERISVAFDVLYKSWGPPVATR